MPMNVKSISLGAILCLFGFHNLGADALPQPCVPSSYTLHVDTYKTRTLVMKRVLVNGVATSSYSQIYLNVPNSGDSPVSELARASITGEVSLNGTQIDELRFNSLSSTWTGLSILFQVSP